MQNGQPIIGFLCGSSSFGGLEMNITRLAFWLQQRDWQVRFFCQADVKVNTFAQEKNLQVHPIQKHRKYLDFKAAKALKKLLVEQQVDVLIIRDTYDMSIAGLVKRMLGGKLKLIYLQAMQLGISKRDLLHTLRFQQIDRWIAPLEFLAQQVREMTRYNQNNLRVIPLGLELDRFLEVGLTQEEAREKMELPTGFIAGLMGRLDPQKGQITAIEALHLLHSHGEKIHLVLVGEPTQGEGMAYVDKLQAAVKSHHLEDYVHFRSFMSQAEIFYQAIDTFVMASQGETFGMVTIEAMASGTPVIGTNTSGTPELLQQGQIGELFTPGNANELASKLLLLATNQQHLASLAKKGRDEAKLRYSNTALCEGIEAQLAELGITQ